MGLGELKSSHEILPEPSTGSGASRGSLNFYPAVLDLNLKGPWPPRRHKENRAQVDSPEKRERKRLKPPEKKKRRRNDPVIIVRGPAGRFHRVQVAIPPGGTRPPLDGPRITIKIIITNLGELKGLRWPLIDRPLGRSDYVNSSAVDARIVWILSDSRELPSNSRSLLRGVR